MKPFDVGMLMSGANSVNDQKLEDTEEIEAIKKKYYLKKIKLIQQIKFLEQLEETEISLMK